MFFISMLMIHPTVNDTLSPFILSLSLQIKISISSCCIQIAVLSTVRQCPFIYLLCNIKLLFTLNSPNHKAILRSLPKGKKETRKRCCQSRNEQKFKCLKKLSWISVFLHENQNFFCSSPITMHLHWFYGYSSRRSE